jgi:hypothetical protein
MYEMLNINTAGASIAKGIKIILNRLIIIA